MDFLRILLEYSKNINEMLRIHMNSKVYFCTTTLQSTVMFSWLQHKTKLQKLQDQYSKLMKSSYITALKDKRKSDRLHEKANKILIEIKKMEHGMQ